MYYSNGSHTAPVGVPFAGQQPPYALMVPRNQKPPRQPFIDAPPPLGPAMAPPDIPAPRGSLGPAVHRPHVGGYPAVLPYAPPRHQTEPVPSDDERYRKQLIVNYLAPDVSSAELHHLFSRIGPLDGARIIYDRQTSLPKGYGFVYFCKPEDAKQAVSTMNGFDFHGKRLKVGYSTNPLNIVSSVSNQENNLSLF